MQREEIVKEILRLRDEGKKAPEIAVHFQEKAVQTTRGSPISRNYVYDVFRENRVGQKNAKKRIYRTDEFRKSRREKPSLFNIPVVEENAAPPSSFQKRSGGKVLAVICETNQLADLWREFQS